MLSNFFKIDALELHLIYQDMVKVHKNLFLGYALPVIFLHNIFTINHGLPSLIAQWRNKTIKGHIW